MADYENSQLSCPICEICFTKKQNLHAHMRTFHADSSFVGCKICNATFTSDRELKSHFVESHPALKIFCCIKCDKFFTSQPGLKSHLKKKHASEIEEQSQFSATCPICSENFRNVPVLQQHIQSIHEDINLSFRKIIFDSVADFDKWKEETETESCCSYVKHHGDKKTEDGTTYSYFYCHRAGEYVEKRERQRRLKCLGSNKIGSTCPAHISVRKVPGTEAKLEVGYQSVHLGHKEDIGRLPLNKSERTLLAGKMMLGIPKSTILTEIREEFSTAKRLCLTQQKDLHNICRDFKVDKKFILHKDDAISVDIKVRKMQNESSNSILIYKPVGELSVEHPGIQQEDFMLAIMNDAQQKILELYGENGLMIDSTHGMNKYDFQLTTLMVNDANHEGFPVATVYSTKVSSEAFVPFFKEIKARVPNLQPKLFMSDDAPAFYNAYATVFGEVEFHLLCSWHVKRAWNVNLSKIKSKPERATVKKDLQILLTETDVTTFEVLSNEMIQKWSSNSEMQEFAQYFISHYMNRPKLWAHCYRKHCGINTNMKLERWHRQLKHEEGQGKVIKRLDKSLSLVLSAISKKLIGRIVALERGKLTARVSEIRKRHDKSKDLNPDDVIEAELRKLWYVPSSRVQSSTMLLETYTVTYESGCACDIKCHDCNVCIHQFSCTCYDYSIHFIMCKHIHLVCQNYSYGEVMLRDTSDQNTLLTDTLVMDISENDSVRHEERSAIETQLQTVIKPTLNQEQQKLQLKLELSAMVDACSTDEELKQIQNTMHILKMQFAAQNAAKKITMPPVLEVLNKQPANKNIRPQNYFGN